MSYNGFDNRQTYILYSLITGQQSSTLIRRLKKAKSIKANIKSIYRGVIYSPDNNPLKRLIAIEGIKPIAYKQIITKFKAKYPKI